MKHKSICDVRKSNKLPCSGCKYNHICEEYKKKTKKEKR